MAKYLMLKHYRMPAEYMDFTPMEEWSPDEVDAHIAYMNAFADRLREAGELVDSQALSPEGTFVRSGGDGKPPVTDGPFPETKDLIAGWMVIDVECWRARPRPRRRALGRTGQGRAADQRMARTAPLPRPGAERR
jgi:hypothetical protein